MEVIIDEKSGFCFGVKKAISMAEKELSGSGTLYCLGDIVHNENEVERLNRLGLKVISRADYFKLSNCKVLLRAHGEPPEVYEHARQHNIELLDGTCPVVSKLQQKVIASFKQLENKGTLLIFGKPQHPEVVGMNGQIGYKAVVVQDKEDLDHINYSQPIALYSQTTMSREKYWELKMEIERRLDNPELLDAFDTICGQVANRVPWLREFGKKVDAIVFVGGKKSSNSKVLFEQCKIANEHSFFIGSVHDLKDLELKSFQIIGVSGATSTPDWLLKEVAEAIKSL